MVTKKTMITKDFSIDFQLQLPESQQEVALLETPMEINLTFPVGPRASRGVRLERSQQMPSLMKSG